MILAVVITSVVLAFVAYLLQARRDLMMLQQNSYRNDRYRRWMSQSGESTQVSRLVALCVAFVSCLSAVRPIWAAVLVGVFSLVMIVVLATRKYKKPLVFTKRVWRIYMVDILLVIATFFLPFLVIKVESWEHSLSVLAILLCFCFAASYLFVLMANWLLQPVEAAINKGFYDLAAASLASMPELKVIGITGSYGKTSTKHYLQRILSEEYDVLMTPGNFNTTLGVVRTINEYLKPYNQVFIVEMGAKELGDIKEICDLVHPSVGIVSAVGPQHLESFKSIENVQKTKFELIDALPADGLAVVNNDFEYIANRTVDNVRCLRYSSEDHCPADYHATKISYGANGTSFSISDASGEVITLQTSLVGRHNISNLMAAVIVALHLGMDKQRIRYAVEKIRQVEHRLSIKKVPGGLTIIDDAYNSNPTGSAMALEVLAEMRDGQRIIITPGMIELGDEQYKLNFEFGQKIAQSADVIIVVGQYNRDAILEGLQHAECPEEKVHAVDNFAQAQSLLASIAHAGDTVLYENDLPDTFK